LSDFWKVLSEHASYIGTDDEWLINLLQYFTVIHYLEHRSLPIVFVDFLKKAVSKDTEFEILLGHIEKSDLASAIKHVGENLNRNRCKWPYIGLAVPVLLCHERYEQALTLLKVAIPNVHPLFTGTLAEKCIAAKCEALFGIHDEQSLRELRQELANHQTNSTRLLRDVQLSVAFYSFKFLHFLECWNN
uniref:Rav1p_C domain-containing protein n=1 Tax=Gongylonema pulchrum TaxID=637853 RepID=A0A183EU39_9BILA